MPRNAIQHDFDIIDRARCLCDAIVGQRKAWEGPRGGIEIAEILVAEIERLRPLARWIPITERLPEEGALVLIGGTGNAGWFWGEARYEGRQWLLFDPIVNAHVVPCEYPSHWIALPPPPLDYMGPL